MTVSIPAARALSGYGLHICALQESDLADLEAQGVEVEWGDSKPENCVAVHGEDLARALAAIVDLEEGEIVWSSVPGETNEKGECDFHPLPRDSSFTVAYLHDVLKTFLPDAF